MPRAGGRATCPRRAAPRRTPGGSAGGWSCHVPEAGASQLYHWRIDDELMVPDPASRFNPTGVHQPSQVVDPGAFAWDADWTGRPWNEVVLYELHVGAFTPEGTYTAA